MHEYVQLFRAPRGITQCMSMYSCSEPQRYQNVINQRRLPIALASNSHHLVRKKSITRAASAVRCPAGLGLPIGVHYISSKHSPRPAFDTPTHTLHIHKTSQLSRSFHARHHHAISSIHADSVFAEFVARLVMQLGRRKLPPAWRSLIAKPGSFRGVAQFDREAGSVSKARAAGSRIEGRCSCCSSSLLVLCVACDRSIAKVPARH